jgi:hypothetical protein
VKHHITILDEAKRGAPEKRLNQIKRPIPLNPSNAELNPMCHLLALLGAHHILHVSVLRVKNVTTKTEN